MSIPGRVVVIGIAALGAAATGIKKGADGLRKRRQGKRIVADARADFDGHVLVLKQLETECNAALADLGRQRHLVFSQTMPAFIAVVSRLRNAEVAADALREQIRPTDVPVGALHDITIKEIEVLGTAAAGVLSAVAASQATSAAVASFASATTGTSISSLSGAAAANAQMAWLGGGSLASGGLGVSGGAAVMSGVAAAPAILIVGVIFDRQMEKLHKEAKANVEELRSAVAKINARSARVEAVTEAAASATPILVTLQSQLDALSENLGRLADADEDVRNWTDEDQQQLRSAGNLAGVLVALASSPLIDEDGELDQRFKDAAARAARLV